MGFGDHCFTWIRKFIEFLSISILINCSLSLEFTMFHKLLQVYPLSQLLFIIIVEGFQVLIDNSIEVGLLRVISSLSLALMLSYLVLFYDILILFDLVSSLAFSFKHLVIIFYGISSKNIKFTSSTIIGVTLDPTIISFTSSLNYGLVPSLFSTLVCQLRAMSKSIAIWQPLIDMLLAPLFLEDPTALYGGQIILIKFILFILPIFLLSIHFISTSVLVTIQSMVSHFFWGGSN